jgi:hypothetical protein
VLCMVMEMYGATGEGTRIYLSGCPAAIFIEPGINGQGFDFSNVPGFGQQLGTYMSYLTNPTTPWGWLSRITQTYAPASGPLVTNAAYPGAVGIVTQNGLLGTPAPGTQVQVKGWRRLSLRSPELTGVYKTLGPTLVQAGPPQTWTYFLAGTSNIQPNNFYTTGSIALYNPTFNQYIQWLPVLATGRKRGARFAAPRGRSSIRT